MDLGNLLDFLREAQKRIFVSLLLTIPIAYTFLYMINYEGFSQMDVYSRLAFSFAFAILSIVVNYSVVALSHVFNRQPPVFDIMLFLFPQSVAFFVFLVSRDISTSLFLYACTIVALFLIPFLEVIHHLVMTKHRKKYKNKQSNKH